MRTASFAETEIVDDMIVSLYLIYENNPIGGYSLIIMRSPKYDRFLYEHEQKARITCDDEELEVDQYLESVEIDKTEKTLKIVGTKKYYEIGLLGPSES